MHDSHHTRVCAVAIGHMAAEMSARDCTRAVFGLFAVSAHFTPGISRTKAMGKGPFLHLVPRARYALQRPGFATQHFPGTSATSCKKSALYSQRFRLPATQIGPIAR